MRWDRLFSDLEAQFERESDDEQRDELRDLTRHQLGLTTAAMLCGSWTGRPAEVTVTGGHLTVSGRITYSGPDWVALSREPTHHALGAGVVTIVRLSSVVSCAMGVMGEAVAAATLLATERSSQANRLTFVKLLRDLARRRVGVTMHTEGVDMTGTLASVGSDWCELVEHTPGSRVPSSARTRVVFATAIHAVTLWD